MSGRILGFLLFVLLALSSIFFAGTRLQNAQLVELDFLLQEKERWRTTNASLSIIAQLEYLRERLENAEDPVDYYRAEAQAQVVSSHYLPIPSNKGTTIELHVVTRFIRAMLGRQAKSLYVHPDLIKDVTYAYYFERNQDFELAAQLYVDMLASYSLDETIKEVIKLHLAYCSLENARYSEANIIAGELLHSENEQVSVAAAELIEIVDAVTRRIESITVASFSPMEQAIHYYVTLQYRKLIEVLTNELSESSDFSDGNIQQMRYVLARGLEEIGDTENAIVEYRRLLYFSPHSRYALEAARRLAMIDAFYDSSVADIGHSINLLSENNDLVLDALLLKELYQKSVDLEYEQPANNNDLSIIGAEIYITTEPEGALIWLNGKRMGFSPIYLRRVPSGETEIRAVYNYEEWKKEIILQDGDIISAKLNLIPNRVTLLLRTDIDVSKVYIDDIQYPVTNQLRFADVPTGTHIVTVVGRDADGKDIFFESEVLFEEGVVEIDVH